MGFSFSTAAPCIVGIASGLRQTRRVQSSVASHAIRTAFSIMLAACHAST
ncbi:hypothetical protein BURMUCGD1_3688 [Burkholderia multivorans CGD1]|nr:hypothetical protein BURMUCGD1_3688 [Burkholderia multivorans CGD1]